MQLTYLLLFTMIASVSCLSGSEVAAFCTCNLTASFCDFNCCCDTDCSNTIPSECSNRKSQSYCPDPTFFQRSGQFKTSTGCYYYNSTNAIVEEVNLTSNVVNLLMNKLPSFKRITTTVFNKGYRPLDIILSIIPPVLSDGTCSSSTAAQSYPIYFGMNLVISCNKASPTTSSATLNIFKSFLNVAVPQYLNDITRTVLIPSSTSDMTSLQLTFVIGNYGSQNIKYIEQVVASSNTEVSNQMTLKIVFLQPEQIQRSTNSASFFPQIPVDMFYPIYLFS